MDDIQKGRKMKKVSKLIAILVMTAMFMSICVVASA